ncbi:unnamed protein product [Vicia faba]|uniref:Tyrosine--tRNA ligase n=1 Tax=Vicia faba TaxID=3906 RepID=A0AAV0YJF1_VICFA|nr:unnamed protein product [Vicia faba]
MVENWRGKEMEWACEKVYGHVVNFLSARGVNVQIGGSDQWGNIIVRTELIRKILQIEGAIGTYCFTFPLLLKVMVHDVGLVVEQDGWILDWRFVQRHQIDSIQLDLNVFYHSVILTARGDLKEISKDDISDAFEMIIVGPKKKNAIVS